MITGQPSFRIKEADDEFDSASPTILPTKESASLEATLAYLNSDAALEILAAINPTINNRVTDILALPIPPVLAERTAEVERSSIQAIEATKALDAFWETSPDAEITLPQTRSKVSEAIESQIARYKNFAGDLASAEAGLNRLLPGSAEFNAPHGWTGASLDTGAAVVNLISYAVGCMFGRYSLESPGLILAEQGSTLHDYLKKVPSPSFMPDSDNVVPIVDGDWFEDDIVARFRKFLRIAFGEENLEENLRFVTDSLGVKDVRDYFVKFFYADHVRRYKKRPIYWLFRSPKGSFSALIYLHRYSRSTVSTVLTGYLREFIGKLEANLEHQGRVAAGMGGASAREITIALKEADRIRRVLVELRDYEHDVLFPLAGEQMDLDLNDGVLVNYQKLGFALKDIGLKNGGAE
jgi:hypothetical protein